MLYKSFFVLLASLVAICLCSPVKKSCFKPDHFKNVDEVVDYVRCIKTITGSPPYGKRSVEQYVPSFQKPSSGFQDYDPEYVEELLYRLLKAD